MVAIICQKILSIKGNYQKEIELMGKNNNYD